MKIAINHLTRMQSGYMCTAGLELGTLRHIRPVLPGRRLKTPLLRRYGGPFDMALVVELGPVAAIPNPPELEDHEFHPPCARAIEPMKAAAFWDMLLDVAQPRLKTIFGEDLTARGGKSAGVDVGKGTASLGCLIPSSDPELYVRARVGGMGQVRIAVSDGQFDLDLGVTDIRLYGDDHVTPRSDLLAGLNRRIFHGEALVLSVGLTRPYASTPDQKPIHWLQVTNVHLADDAAWRLR